MHSQKIERVGLYNMASVFMLYQKYLKYYVQLQLNTGPAVNCRGTEIDRRARFPAGDDVPT